MGWSGRWIRLTVLGGRRSLSCLDSITIKEESSPSFLSSIKIRFPLQWLQEGGLLLGERCRLPQSGHDLHRSFPSFCRVKDSSLNSFHFAAIVRNSY